MVLIDGTRSWETRERVRPNRGKQAGWRYTRDEVSQQDMFTRRI